MQLSLSQNKIIDRFNFHELPEINQAQFLIAGRNAWGPSKTSLLDIFSAGDDGEEMGWEFFKITGTDSHIHLYDGWVLSDDSGTVFIANSAKPADIEMSQSYFDAVTSNEDTKALAENIQAAYKQSVKAFDSKEGGFDSAAFRSYWDDFYKKKDAVTTDEAYWTGLTSKLELLLVSRPETG